MSELNQGRCEGLSFHVHSGICLNCPHWAFLQNTFRPLALSLEKAEGSKGRF